MTSPQSYEAFQQELREDIENVSKILDEYEAWLDEYEASGTAHAAAERARMFMTRLGVILMISLATPEEVRKAQNAPPKK